MTIIDVKLTDLKPYEKNPRHNEEAVKGVANSIKQFGFKVPIIIDKNNVIVAGHTRYKAALELGMETVPCIIADDLTPKQIKAFRLADNKVAEKSYWDFDLLNEELADLKIDFNMSDFGFNFDENLPFDDSGNDGGDVEGGKDDTDDFGDEGEEPKYTMDTKAPIYEITGECPELSELVDTSKTDELKEEIENAKIPVDIKKFLMLSAERHLLFDYAKIAEYYAHASKDIQELMEKSALVIIDFDKSIEYGFTRLSERIEKLRDENK